METQTIDVNVWTWDASVLLGLAALVGAYVYGVSVLRRQGLETEITNRHVFFFASGILLLFLALESPLAHIGENFLFSVHMVKHILLQMIVPALILLGIPRWMMRALLNALRIGPLLKLVTHPVIAFIAFNTALIVWHIPALYEAALREPMLHIAEHGIFIATGFICWYPVIDAARQHDQFSYMAKIVYLFLFVIPSGILGAVFAFAQVPLYATYASAPRLWELSVLDDQALAGGIMWVPGWLIYFIALSVVFALWMKHEDAKATQTSS